MLKLLCSHSSKTRKVSPSPPPDHKKKSKHKQKKSKKTKSKSRDHGSSSRRSSGNSYDSEPESSAESTTSTAKDIPKKKHKRAKEGKKSRWEPLPLDIIEDYKQDNDPFRPLTEFVGDRLKLAKEVLKSVNMDTVNEILPEFKLEKPAIPVDKITKKVRTKEERRKKCREKIVTKDPEELEDEKPSTSLSNVPKEIEMPNLQAVSPFSSSRSISSGREIADSTGADNQNQVEVEKEVETEDLKESTDSRQSLPQQVPAISTTTGIDCTDDEDNDSEEYPEYPEVYSLADCFVKELAESSPQLNITANDELCVVIAALVHDLGHGPFSHLYEEFLHVANPSAKFRHETNSTRILELMFKNNSQLKQALDEYLDEEDYEFIYELIDPPPPPFILNGEWKLRGRPVEKSFLYDIVSNKHDGLDVDKFDYFLRDSKLGNLPIPFSMTTVGRIRDNCKALFDDQLGYKRLVFAEKNLDEIKDAFESRVKLHDRLYHHKTCIAAEILLIEALRLADPHLKIRGGSKALCLSTVFLDPLAFLKLDDRIIYQIMMSEDKSMLPAQNLLSQLQLRRFPRYVCSISLDNYEHLPTTPEEVKRGILLQSKLLSDSDVIVKVHCIHRGLGAFNSPLAFVRVYNRGHQVATSSTKLISKTWLKYNTLPMGGKGVANIYAPFDTTEAILKELQTAANTYEALQSSSEVEFLLNLN
uniref:HD domain-containing protein n=1 Tax=Ditylenchus dipsaci TaxID=166011 RepID=A0A915EFQ0_9BILA